MSSEGPAPEIGSIIWTDLTVDNAAEVRDFYTSVVGWNSTPHDMGEYDDYNILTPGQGRPVAGVCHARGPNANIPPQWMVYILVEDVDESARRCQELGGEVVDGPRSMDQWRFCIIKDPAGAVCALMNQQAASSAAVI